MSEDEKAGRVLASPAQSEEGAGSVKVGSARQPSDSAKQDTFTTTESGGAHLPVERKPEHAQNEAEIERLLAVTYDDIGRVRCNSSAGINHGAAQLAALARRLLSERDIARKHAREHHLEACETCAAIESERDAERDSRKVQEGMTREAVRQRDEARGLHDHCCGKGRERGALERPCMPPWRPR